MTQIFLDRNKIIDWLPKNAIIAEIGVLMCGFSIEIFNRCQPLKFHLIDPWSQSSEIIFGKIPQNVWENLYIGVKEWANQHDNIIVNRGFSQDVLESFEDNYFDWVYIDGDHSLKCTREDILLCNKKVKFNGFICGHDFNFNEVKIAVIESIYEGRCKMVGMTPTFPSQFPSYVLQNKTT
jgi:hypothetical protein